MGELFQVIFNSQGSNVISNASKAAVVYNVNWKAILGDKYKKFKCNINFKSEKVVGALEDVGFISMNIGKINTFDGLQQSNNIGIIYPYYYNGGTTTSIYTCNATDNNAFYINYPTFNNVTVLLKDFNGTGDTDSMPHYVLMLSLEGIE
jgi:hypothetical protein